MTCFWPYIEWCRSVTGVDSLFKSAEFVGDIDTISNKSFDTLNIMMDSSNQLHENQFLIQQIGSSVVCRLSIVNLEPLSDSTGIRATFQMERCPFGEPVKGDKLAQSVMDSVVAQWDALAARINTNLPRFQISSDLTASQAEGEDENDLALVRFESMLDSFGFSGISQTSSIKPVGCDGTDIQNPCTKFGDDDNDDDNENVAVISFPSSPSLFFFSAILSLSLFFVC